MFTAHFFCFFLLHREGGTHGAFVAYVCRHSSREICSGTGSDGLTDTAAGRFVLPRCSTVGLHCIRCHVPWSWRSMLDMCPWQDILWHWVECDRWCRHDSLSVSTRIRICVNTGWFHTCETLGSLTLSHLTSNEEQKCGMPPWIGIDFWRWNVRSFVTDHVIQPCALFVSRCPYPSLSNRPLPSPFSLFLFIQLWVCVCVFLALTVCLIHIYI